MDATYRQVYLHMYSTLSQNNVSSNYHIVRNLGGKKLWQIIVSDDYMRR